MIVAHLLASPFFGGPERQALGLCQHLPPSIETHFYSYAEGGKARVFLDRASEAGFSATELKQNWPHLLRCRRELADHLTATNAAALCTHGYKPDIIGLLAARAARIPAISIAHGWTSATWKVRLNERLDKLAMRHFDRVVGVSDAQSQRVRDAGVNASRIITIHNAIALNELKSQDTSHREELEKFFPFRPSVILLAAGRLSPEKGFDVLINAAQQVVKRLPDAGFIIFGAGPLEATLRKQIEDQSLSRNVILGGFRNDLDRLIPQADGFVLSSRTEGLPVILLEALGSGVPSVATPVGGVPEMITDGVHGLIANTDDASSLASQIIRLCEDEALRLRCIRHGQERVAAEFTHTLQAQKFVSMLDSVITKAKTAQ